MDAPWAELDGIGGPPRLRSEPLAGRRIRGRGRGQDILNAHPVSADDLIDEEDFDRAERLTGEWARALSNAHLFRQRLTGCLLWYRLEPVADAPDTVDVGVVRRRLYAGPDAADVHIHRAAGGTPPGRPRTPDQLSATHGHP